MESFLTRCHNSYCQVEGNGQYLIFNKSEQTLEFFPLSQACARKKRNTINRPLLLDPVTTQSPKSIRKVGEFTIPVYISSDPLLKQKKRETAHFPELTSSEKNAAELCARRHWRERALRNTQERRVRSKIWWFTEFCNSQDVSQFAAFFIDAGTKISVAKSCTEV